MNLTKKIGPLPVWAWGIIGGVVVYFLYERYKTSSSSATNTGASASLLDPNQVDPNTGLTYGQEESAALNANAAQLAGSGSAGAPTSSGVQNTVPPTNEFGDFLTFLSDWNQFAQASGWQPPGTASNTTTTASTSPPVQGSSPPTTTPAANTTTTIDTHPGGPFYTWYVKVFGRPPLAHIPSNGAAYTLWKNGVSVTTARQLVAASGNKTATATANTLAAAGSALNPTKSKSGPYKVT